MVAQGVIQNTISNYFAANNGLDIERFVNAFTEGAVLYYAGPTSPMSGPEAVRQVAEQSLAPFSKLEATVQRIFFAEDGAAVFYRVQMTAKNGRSAASEGIDVMEITDEGKICAIRFYMDIEPLLALFQ